MTQEQIFKDYNKKIKDVHKAFSKKMTEARDKFLYEYGAKNLGELPKKQLHLYFKAEGDLVSEILGPQIVKLMKDAYYKCKKYNFKNRLTDLVDNGEITI